ncbi:hypothetical protein [Eleftheria terrae]|uniref:hypothetical protein n=1 Tax=Eleftheria terrae TaxID=1597781 RepID=UPI00263B195C|nr:hypothetical protein [Eleftheria terrae]WKB50507.1 hypothetical protein N7L95_00225 [Eleftheria terrae]
MTRGMTHAMRRGLFAVSLVLLTGLGAVAPKPAQAQIPTTDILTNTQLTIDYGNQMNQYAELVDQYTQQLEDYQLQLQNLQQLPGTIRAQVRNRFSHQLTSTHQDYGLSYLNQYIRLNPAAGSYYPQLESMLKTALTVVPRTMNALNLDMEALDLPQDLSNPVWKRAYTDRIQYERLLDDHRALALQRQNAQERAQEAAAITSQMQALPDNNTVGAIQLLAAQNSLTYMQNEELLKANALLAKPIQQKEAEILANREARRQLELERVKRAQVRSYTMSINETP